MLLTHFNGRRGVSGEVVAYQDSVIRTVAKQQQSVSLSSCESELFAIQMAAQDSVALSRFTHRFLFGLGEIDEPDPVELFLETDSLSAIQLLEGVDIPRRSRHVEVRVMWLKEKMSSGVLKLQHRFGVGNCADLFTKCLGTRDFLRLRSLLGFQSLSEPLEALNQASETMILNQMIEKATHCICGSLLFGEVLFEHCVCGSQDPVPWHCSKYAECRCGAEIS